MSDYSEWMKIAKRDLRSAHKLNDGEDTSDVCYHCQQAAEKAVKSLIVLYGSQGGMPKKHDIFLLLNQIRNMVNIDEKFYDYADILSPYGVAMRYPNELVLEERHAERALAMADEFVRWAEDSLKG